MIYLKNYFNPLNDFFEGYDDLKKGNYKKGAIEVTVAFAKIYPISLSLFR